MRLAITRPMLDAHSRSMPSALHQLYGAAILQPRQQPGEFPAIDDPRRGNAGEPRMRNRRVRTDERLAVVRVAVERKQAARVTGAFREFVIEILAGGITVISMATPSAAASSNTRCQSAMMPERASTLAAE